MRLNHHIVSIICALLPISTSAAEESPTKAFTAAVTRAEHSLLATLAEKASAPDRQHIDQFLAGAVHHAWALSSNARQLNFPRFSHNYELVGMPGLVNPDTHYSSALLEDSGAYTISGVRGSHKHLTLQFIDGFPMISLGKDLLVIDLNTLGIEEGQAFTLRIGGAQHDGHWWPMPTGTQAVLARQTFSSWSQTLSSLTIRRDDTARPLNSINTARMALAAEYLDKIVDLWANTYLAGLRRLPVNQFPPIRPSGTEGGGLRGQYGVITRFRLQPDEAAIIKVRKSDAAYQGIQIGNRWFVTPDPLRTLASLNNAQARASKDGYFYFTISYHDPGVWNWLQARDIEQGYVMVRWQALQSPLTKDDQPTLQVVKLANLLDSLPTEVDRITPKQRRAQIAERRTLPALKQLAAH